MSFVPQNEFEHSLLRAVSEPAYRPKFMRDFIRATLHVIERAGADPGRSDAAFETIEIDGKSSVAAFTSLPRLQSVLQAEATPREITVVELLGATVGSALVLNPGSDCSRFFTREELREILDGIGWKPKSGPETQSAPRQLTGPSPEYPRLLVEYLSHSFSTLKEVKRAWLLESVSAAGDAASPLRVTLEVSGDWDSIVAQAAHVAREVPVAGPPVEFVPYDGRAGAVVREERRLRPFYRRKLFGLF